MDKYILTDDEDYHETSDDLETLKEIYKALKGRGHKFTPPIWIIQIIEVLE